MFTRLGRLGKRIFMLIGAFTKKSVMIFDQWEKGYGGHTHWPQRASASRSGHARVNDAQRVRAHETRMSLLSKTADDTLYRRHGATYDDVALLITAMRSNVEHPGEDARAQLFGKNTVSLDGLLLESAAAFPVPISQRRRRPRQQNETYELEIPNDVACFKSKIASYDLQSGTETMNEDKWNISWCFVEMR